MMSSGMGDSSTLSIFASLWIIEIQDLVACLDTVGDRLEHVACGSSDVGDECFTPIVVRTEK